MVIHSTMAYRELTISLVCGEEWARMVALNKFELGI